MKNALIVLALLIVQGILCDPAWAINEEDYQTTFNTKVLPFFEKNGVIGSLEGREGVTLRYRFYDRPSAKGAILISNGYTENMYQYAELAYDFYQLGYSVFLIDHRGQGASDRLLADPELAHIDRFENFVDDLKSYYEQIVKPKSAGLDVFLIGHSMGGGIGARYLELYPQDFKAAVLVAPMIGIRLGDWNPVFAKVLLKSIRLFGGGHQIAFGQEKAELENDIDPNNLLSRSAVRYRVQRRLSVLPGIELLRAPTNDWILKALNAGRSIIESAGLAKAPILLLQAEEEKIVVNQSQDKFCARAFNCRKLIAHGARHDVLKEADPIKEKALESITQFLDAHIR